jgi:8-oxo-dGTP diphosphatase
MRISCSAGGLIVKENKVLLVKVTYGANKGHWMLPGGMVEEGEAFEQAAIREVKEETGINATTKRLIGVRTGIKPFNNEKEHVVHFVFEMDYVSGVLAADGSEISDAVFRPIDDVLNDPLVINLSKQFVRSYLDVSPYSGLSKVQVNIQTNNPYLNYDVYGLI